MQTKKDKLTFLITLLLLLQCTQSCILVLLTGLMFTGQHLSYTTFNAFIISKYFCFTRTVQSDFNWQWHALWLTRCFLHFNKNLKNQTDHINRFVVKISFIVPTCYIPHHWLPTNTYHRFHSTHFLNCLIHIRSLSHVISNFVGIQLYISNDMSTHTHTHTHAPDNWPVPIIGRLFVLVSILFPL